MCVCNQLEHAINSAITLDLIVAIYHFVVCMFQLMSSYSHSCSGSGSIGNYFCDMCRSYFLPVVSAHLVSLFILLQKVSMLSTTL